MRQYGQCMHIFKGELNASPQVQMVNLYNAIRTERLGSQSIEAISTPKTRYTKIRYSFDCQSSGFYHDSCLGGQTGHKFADVF